MYHHPDSIFWSYTINLHNSAMTLQCRNCSLCSIGIWQANMPNIFWIWGFIVGTWKYRLIEVSEKAQSHTIESLSLWYANDVLFHLIRFLFEIQRWRGQPLGIALQECDFAISSVSLWNSVYEYTILCPLIFMHIVCFYSVLHQDALGRYYS